MLPQVTERFISCSMIIIIMVQQFINRLDEIKSLKDELSKKRASMGIIYGRRRIGKTELSLRLLKNAKGFYYLAENRDYQHNLRQFQKVAGEYLKDPMFEKIDFTSWVDMAEELGKRLSKERTKTVIIIDELPYMVEHGVLEELQKAWDLHLSKSKVFLLLVGSSMSMMERLTLDYKAPLYGRRTMQLKVEKLPIWHSAKFHPRFSLQQAIEAFSVLDGVPLYLQQFDDRLDTLKNLELNYLRKDRLLYEEAEILLRLELREFRRYFQVLHSIASGNRGFGDISSSTKIDTATLSKYLSNLKELGFIKDDLPFGAERARLKRYRLCDNYFSFWFRFVFPNKRLIEMGRLDELLVILKRDLPSHVSFVFEDIIRDILVRYFGYHDAKAWWNRIGEEIDVVALDTIHKTALFGEVKWGEANPNDYHQLMEKSSLVTIPEGYNKKYLIVGRQIRKKDELKVEKVMMIDIKDLEAIFKEKVPLG